MADNPSTHARPLSHRQHMIWAGQVLDPDIPLYNMVHAFAVDADIDVALFRDAFRALVEGTDALRTVITKQSGNPAQRVLQTMDSTLPFLELPEHELASWLQERARVRFDLETKLFDSVLIRTAEHRYVWYLNQHHLITDAWSLSVLLRRQADLYQLAIDGRLEDAEPFPTFGDFLDSEGEPLGPDARQKSADYWRNKLTAPSEPLTFYSQRPADLGTETLRVKAVIDGSRAERLDRFLASPEMAALSPELTAMRFFLTVLFAYLHRVCDQDQLLVGAPFHNRSKRKAKQTAGLFMNLYPVMATIDSGETMLELSNKVGADVFDSMQHARFTIDAEDERGAFEVLLNYLHVPYETFGERQVEDTWVHPGASDRATSLGLQIRKNDGPGFRLFFDVKTALFDEAARQQLVQQFLRIVDAWIHDVHVPVSAISLLSPLDRQRLVTGFNQPSGPEVPNTTVVEDFEAMALSRPTDQAVVSAAADPREALTYEALNVQANRVANHLLANGVQPGDLVGVRLPRTPSAVVAILGILKAGAAYVPLEVDIPPARFTRILQDTGARLVCTDPAGEAAVRDAKATPVLVQVVASAGGLVDHNPTVNRSLDHPAYAIFTSGSTGRPKGVPVHHRGLNNYVTWARRQYTDGKPLVFALFTSLAFDLTVTSIFVPLTSGGSIVTYPDDVADGTPAVVQVWRDDRVDVAKATPSHLSIIRRLGLSAKHLKVVVIGGEDLTTDLANAVQDLHPGLAVYNEYGPTETVVGCMIHRFDSERDRWPSVPIGTPAANAEILLLDRYGSPVPPGVIGQIHIGGPGVTGGYLNQPDATAERFVNRPILAGDIGKPTVLYRSGDLGRWRLGTAEPELEFLGRADDQVKIGGNRIELGEIEAALSALSAVEAAAVTVVTETIGGAGTGEFAGEFAEEFGSGVQRETSRLIGHYQSPTPIAGGELRTHLAKLLPAYMVPTTFVHHQALPLTVNAKVDRAALAAIRTTESDRAPALDLDQGERRTATALAVVWADTLGRDVRVTDNFFELGGDSITAIQIVDRAASAGIGLTPRQLFEAQTPAGAALVAVPFDEAGGTPETGPSEIRSSEIITPEISTSEIRIAPDGYPLTPTQSGMLFHSLAEPGSGIYEGQIAHHLRGQVDRQLMERCWHQLAARHQVLRTAFRWKGRDQARQVVTAEVAPTFTYRDWSGIGGTQADSKLEDFLSEDRAMGFDLGAGAPVRIAVLQLPSHPVLVWSFHHIAFDGWSVALAMNELLRSYQAVVDGISWSAPESRPFSQYLDWLSRQDQDKAEAFWRDELASFTAPTSLPRLTGAASTAISRASSVRPYAATQRNLSSQDRSLLLQFARRKRVTLSTVLQAAWGLVLARYEGSDDVVFGVTTSGRPPTLPGAGSMIGMLVTTLPARVRLNGRQTPDSWLQQIQTSQLTVRDHEFASLVDIQQWSDMPPGQSLFDSILVVENFPDYEPPEGHENTGAVTIESRAYRVQSNYPLSLIVLPGPKLTFKVVYDPTQFSTARIDELLDHIEAAIASITGDSAETVDELSILTAREAAKLERWTAGPSLQEPMLIPDRIRQQAADQPDAVAAVSGGEQMTYGQLLARASVLADALREHGLNRNEFVGIKLDRSIEMIIAIVGVMEAGAAYLPLDPSYPKARLDFMLTDANVSILVTTAPTDEAVGDTGLAIHRLGDDPITPAKTDGSVSADDPAYLIYTSGSTGQPNGVPITHGNLAYSTGARVAYYDHQPKAFLLLSSFSFDSSAVGIFWTLTTGGRLVLPAAGEELDMQLLSGLIEQHAVSHMLALPSLHRLLIEFAGAGTPGSLSTVIVAGEPCSRDLVDAHHRVLPEAQLHNEYGPTEASVWCSVHHCGPDESGPVPIGRPIPGATVAVFDRTGRPAGIGVPGEIHVAGPGVAAGYHNRPDLTAERFVELHGRRWFRTRDQGIINGRGLIEFGGRADSQVKLRGFRVELGEVEAVVTSHPAIGNAAAIVTEPDSSAARLVAFVEPRSEATATATADLHAEIRTLVSERLPDPFVPSLIVNVDRLPRLPNGKVDRSRLPEITPERSDRPMRRPGTEAERTIASIWSGLLPGVAFGIDDDFFEVGGHSLLAVALVEKIRRATGVDLPLSALLDTPTVAALGAAVADSATDTTWRCLVPMRTTGNRVPLYLIPPAAGTALSFRTLVAEADPDQPLYCFEAVGTDGKAEPQETVEEMAATYIEELKAAQPHGRYRIGGSCLGAIVAWEMAQQLEAAGTPVELLVFLDPGPPHSGPGWSYRLPTQRSPFEFVRSAIDIVRSGELLAAVQAVWRRNAFERIGRIHYRAQLSYVSDRLRVPILWLQSSEVAEEQPTFLEQWRILAGDDLTPIIVPDTTHDGLMRGVPDEAARLAVLFNEAMSGFEQAVLKGSQDQLPSGSGGASRLPAS